MSDHYFSGSPSAADDRHDVSVHAWGRDLPMQAAAGTFSAGGLDKATAILLRSLDPPAGGRILDLGCGWGPIACAIAAASPTADVWAVDVNERSRDLTRGNAESLSVSVTVAAPDQVPGDLRFDEIWSNPPIRIGKAALHELLSTWLGHLRTGGHANLVVGKNLGADSLQAWLITNGWPTERLNSARGFRVLRAHRPAQ